MSELQVEHAPIARYSSLKSRQGSRGSALGFGDTALLAEQDEKLRCADFGATMSTFDGHFGDTQEIDPAMLDPPTLEDTLQASPEAEDSWASVQEGQLGSLPTPPQQKDELHLRS